MHGTPQAVLEIFHNPDVFFRLNPLIIELTETSPQTYKLVDKLTVLGCIPTTTTYTAVVQFQADGIDADAKASLGTQIKNVFKVKQGPQEGTAEVYHQVVIRALFFLMPYVEGTAQKSHETTLERLQLKLEGQT